MTTLYLIRHAEAEGNLYRRIHGQYNSLITDNGYRQIQALQERFADVPIDAVYSSDLFRTMTTARAIYVPITGYHKHNDYKNAFYMGVATGSASAFSENLATRPEVEALLQTLI